MKKILLFSFTILIFVGVFSCNAQTSKKEAPISTTDKVDVYYFHFSSRCATCKTVEAEAKADIQSLYNGDVSFQVINLDDESSKAIAEKLNISGQTLLIVKGNEKINLTNEGFLYAVNNPVKFKSIIKEKVDGLLGL